MDTMDFEKLKKIRNDWDEAVIKHGSKENHEQIKSHNTGSLQNFYYLDIIKKNQPKKQSVWLDVCCGSASSSLFISEKFDCFSIGFDLSLKRLQIAKQKNKILKTKAEFINADLFHMPFKNDIFDGIIAMQSLSDYKLDEQQKTLQNLKDFLIDGGTFILSDANSTNSSNYNLLGMEKYLEILTDIGYSKITGEGWGGKNFQILWKIRNKILRRLLKKNVELLKKIEMRYNLLLFRIGNFEQKSIKKSFFFHIIGIK